MNSQVSFDYTQVQLQSLTILSIPYISHQCVALGCSDSLGTVIIYVLTQVVNSFEQLAASALSVLFSGLLPDSLNPNPSKLYLSIYVFQICLEILLNQKNENKIKQDKLADQCLFRLFAQRL